MSQQYKEVLTQLGVTPEQIEKLEAGEIKPAEITSTIQDYTFTLIKSDPTKTSSIINPVLEERDKKYLQKIKHQLNLSEEDVINRDPLETLELGINKKKQEMLAEYQNTNDAQLVEKNNKLQEELANVRRTLEDYTTNTVPKLQAEYEAKSRAKDIEVKLREWIKENHQFNISSSLAELAFHKALKDKGYMVELDTNGAKLILLSKDTKTAPLVDPAEGTGVLLLENFAKKVFTTEKLLKQSNAEDSAQNAQQEVWTRQTSAISNVSAQKAPTLMGLDKIKQAQERDRLNKRAIA